MTKMGDDFASEVANHYNQVEQRPFGERNLSAIIELRKFNNAMKSLMHHQAFKFAMIGIQNRQLLSVLDLGCGKGGDLQKYLRSGKVELVVGVDIADVSIEQCKERYKNMRNSNSRCFQGHFFVADLTRIDISKKLQELNLKDKFHIASSQFSIHYSFESYDQAVKYISNACNNIKKHGIFIGTYPDGPKILRLARESPTPGLYEVEDVMSIKFDPEDLKNPRPFGTKYHFKLAEVVDCPEFLVHPEILRKIMKTLGFFEVFDRSFEENLKSGIENNNDGSIVKSIFENHLALRFNRENRTATLDDRMWRAASIYRCFCYKKMRDDDE